MSPDLIEEQRAAVGFLELAGLLGRGAGERALAMAEQLAFDHVLGNGRAVDLHEHLVPPQALGVDGPRHQFLARARFAVDQDATISRRHQSDLLAQRLQRNAVAHDLARRKDWRLRS